MPGCPGQSCLKAGQSKNCTRLSCQAVTLSISSHSYCIEKLLFAYLPTYRFLFGHIEVKNRNFFTIIKILHQTFSSLLGSGMRPILIVMWICGIFTTVTVLQGIYWTPWCIWNLILSSIHMYIFFGSCLRKQGILLYFVAKEQVLVFFTVLYFWALFA